MILAIVALCVWLVVLGTIARRASRDQGSMRWYWHLRSKGKLSRQVQDLTLQMELARRERDDLERLVQQMNRERLS